MTVHQPTPAQPTRTRRSPGSLGHRTPRQRRPIALVLLVGMVLIGAACGSDGSDAGGDQGASTPAVDAGSNSSGDGGGASTGDEMFPDVVDVELTESGDGEYDVATTLSSPYDSPERYADAWRVLDPDGNELGVRELGHDHASEQPFTRSSTVSIPDDVDEVTVEGRDQVSGYGGETKTVPVPR